MGPSGHASQGTEDDSALAEQVVLLERELAERDQQLTDLAEVGQYLLTRTQELEQRREDGHQDASEVQALRAQLQAEAKQRQEAEAKVKHAESALQLSERQKLQVESLAQEKVMALLEKNRAIYQKNQDLELQLESLSMVKDPDPVVQKRAAGHPPDELSSVTALPFCSSDGSGESSSFCSSRTEESSSSRACKWWQ